MTSAVEELYQALAARDRPRLCPLRQPFDASLQGKIDALESTKAVRAGTCRRARKDRLNLAAALHLLNDDLYAAHELLHPRTDYAPDRTSKLLHAIMHRREKNYLEAERSSRTCSSRGAGAQGRVIAGYWKLVDHPLLGELYDAHDGPLELQRAMEKADGKRVGEARRGPLEAVQFDELKRVARWAIDNVDER